jgi:predicted GIY-YIG superfamily endonuclease
MRRLRQHNEEIKGGAKATHGKGGAWEICAMLSGFPDHINALSCEWRMKCPSGRPGKREAKYQRVQGRVSSLSEILALDRWTGKCIVDNCDFKFKLHILKDVVEYLDKTKVPENIEIVEVDTIDASCIELEKEIYE